MRRIGLAALALGALLGASNAEAFTYSGTIESAIAETGQAEHKNIPVAGDQFTLDYDGYFIVPSFDVHSVTFNSDFHSNGVFDLGSYAPITKHISVSGDEIDLSFLLFGVFHADFSGEADFKLLVAPVPLPASLPMFGATLLVLGALGFGKRLVGGP